MAVAPWADSVTSILSRRAAIAVVAATIDNRVLSNIGQGAAMADFFDNCNGQFVKDGGVVAFYGRISRHPMADFWLSAMVHHLPPITPSVTCAAAGATQTVTRNPRTITVTP
ncbi:hypothetical protein L195_g040831, partial [Trifolium pratense]